MSRILKVGCLCMQQSLQARWPDGGVATRFIIFGADEARDNIANSKPGIAKYPMVKRRISWYDDVITRDNCLVEIPHAASYQLFCLTNSVCIDLTVVVALFVLAYLTTCTISIHQTRCCRRI